jgi:hypothetical protein
MNLAAILVGSLCLGSAGVPLQNQAAPPPQSQTTPAAETKPAATEVAPSAQTQNPSARPAAKPSRKRGRKTAPDCSTASAAPDKASTVAASTTAAKPCPTPKVVVRNGGTDEPTVQLNGDTSAGKASYDRSTTEQLSAGTEENLRNIAGRDLSAGQQEMASQAKEFMEQSKAAVAAGDLERGHNLAVKAHLLSEELVKP